ncbi:metal ABC transporter permease [Humitalea sp. 24SJ18S-53]|uniref:metal ABC transporter permease n=1 Tax=Humitalea sp. 24SJ18S-53 TaxID=3422307 RepID=UPI003D6759A3
MIEALLIPFQYDYMLSAMWVSAVVGAACGLLSCYVTLKGWSLMGDALSHAVVPGVVIAWVVGAPFAVGAFVSGMMAAGVMSFIRNRTRLREDAVIGIVFTSFFGAGLFLLSIFPSNLRLRTIVFGNILGIAEADVVQMLIVTGGVLAVLAVRGRDLMLVTFDPSHAKAIGLNPGLLGALLLSLLAAMAVAAMQTVGAVLVIAMLVTPGATAYLLTDRFGKMCGIAAGLGAGTSFAGAYLSYFLDGSTGGTIVVLQTLFFLAAMAWAPRHGVMAARRARRVAMTPSAAE